MSPIPGIAPMCESAVGRGGSGPQTDILEYRLDCRTFLPATIAACYRPAEASPNRRRNMTAMQFIHHGGYGKTPGRGRKSYETIAGVTAEAGRVPGNAPHVRYPQAPRVLYGVSPTE